MSNDWEEISNRRLEVQHDTLVTLLQDGPDSLVQDPSQKYTKLVGERPGPGNGHVIHAWEPEPMPNAYMSAFTSGLNDSMCASMTFPPGLTINIFWAQNRLVHTGKYEGAQEFYIGHVELSAGKHYTDVSIVCGEPSFRLYWLWLDKHLALRYREARRGGPIPHSLEERKKAVISVRELLAAGAGPLSVLVNRVPANRQCIADPREY